jgi:hypothetical protein
MKSESSKLESRTGVFSNAEKYYMKILSVLIKVNGKGDWQGKVLWELMVSGVKVIAR